MSELAYTSAGDIAQRIARRELSSREYLEHLLERVEQVDGPLNSVVTLDAERALEEAERCDRESHSGQSRGPLHGVAMTIKDSFQTEGIRTTSGAPELSDHIAAVDADPVARLKAAGAVVYGKTNLPIYAGDTQSYNEIFGTTNNPYDVSRTPGGSSGGSAAALAAGLTPIELGSDIGGSIRGPSSTCGVCGHKPSYGIVSALGQIPGPPGTLTQADIAVAGPMARTVDDLELELDVLAGPNSWEATAYRLELPQARHRRLEDFRVAAWFEEPSCPLDSGVRERLESALDALESEGATIDRSARPQLAFEAATDNFAQLLAAAQCGGQSHGEIEALAQAQMDEGGPRLVGKGAAQRHRSWLSANEKRLQLRQRWREFFTDWDIVLLPTLPTPAIPHDHSQPMAARTIQVDGETRPYWDQLLWVGLIGAVYLPATVVPVGQVEGLPVGLQIAGPYLEDRTTLAFARAVEASCGGFQRPAGF